MALSSRFRGGSALAVSVAALAVALPQSAAAATIPTGADAVAAVTAILAAQQPSGTLPAEDKVLTASYSADGSRVTYRQAFSQPAVPGSYDANNGSDDWVMRADGTQQTRLSTDITWANSGSAPVAVTDAVWAPSGTTLAYDETGPGHLTNLVTRSLTTTTAGDDWSAKQSYGDAGWGTDLAYTGDSHYLVYRLASSSYPAFATDYAIDLTTNIRYTARTLDDRSGTLETTWADECATVTEGAYTPPVHTGNDVVDALTGPNPACKFGVPADPSAPTGTTPTTDSGSHAGTDSTVTTATTQSTGPATSTLNDSPGVTSSTNPNLTPISERIPTITIPGPSLKITDVGTGLAAARTKGLHVKYSLDRLSTVKIWVILMGSATRYATDEAFAGVPATTVARGSIVSSKPGDGSLYAKFDAKGKAKLDSLSRATVQVKMTATDVAGRSTTVVKNVKLRR